MTDIETEVRALMARDPNYPIGERDAMKWAVAFRIIHTDRYGLSPEDDGIMLGWFANAMAQGEMNATGTIPLNADGMGAILDGEMAAPHYLEEAR